MLVQNKQNPFFQKISTLFAGYLAVSSVFPPIRVFQGYNLSCVVAMLAWVVCAGLSNPSFFTIFAKKPFHKQVVLFFVAYTVIVPYLFGNGVIGNRYLFYGQVLIFYLIYQYNRSYGYDNSSKTIIKWSVPFIVITSVLTLFGLISNPYLSRSIKSSGEYTATLQAQGIGGYELIYFLVFMGIMLSYLIMSKRLMLKNFKFGNRVTMYLLMILCIVTVIYSNYFTALIMVIVSLGILFVTRKSSIIIKGFIAITGFTSLIFGKAILISITNWMAQSMSSGRTLDRVLLLQADLLGNSNESLLSGRITTLDASWNALLDSPFLGIVMKKIEYDGGYLTGFGQHSQFLDTFALFGLFIGVLSIYIIVQPFLERMKGSPLLFGLNVAVLVSVLMLFAMNNVTPSIGYAIFFIYPVLYDWQVDRLNAKENNEIQQGRPQKWKIQFR